MANVTYKVVKGDTLSGIAKAKGTTVNALLALNPDITNKDLIYVGQVIIISGTSSPKTTNSSQKAKITNFGLQSNTDRVIFATWAWDKSNTDHYEVEWIYTTGDGVGFIGNKSDVTDKQSTYTAPENATSVAFYVRPISKTYKTKKKDDVKYWNADWSTVKRYYFVESPSVPPVPKFSGDTNAILSLKDFKLTITLNNLGSLNADKIEFKIKNVNGTVFKTGTAKISNNKVSYSCTLAAGEQYVVISRSVKGSLKSEWSGESEAILTIPAASEGIYLIYALNNTTVQVNWYEVDGADSYEIQYTATKRFFDSYPSGVQSQIVEVGYAQIGNLVWGNTYLFRVRSIKSDKKSAWSEIKSIVLAGVPSAPTTWSSQTSVKVGDPLTLYWVHNSQDGSRQTSSELQITVNGSTKTEITRYGNCVSTDNHSTKVVSLFDFSSSDLKEGTIIKVYMLYVNTGSNIKLNVNDIGDISVIASGSLYWDAGSIVTFKYSNDVWVLTYVSTSGNTESYSIDTSGYTEGTSIQWKVRTAGILKDTGGKYIYSEWSTQRTIDVYAPPTVEVNVTDHTENIIEELISFPFNIVIRSGPNTQTPIGYFVSITANESYEDIDESGNTIRVGKGSEVYYKKIDDTSRSLSVPITAGDINLKNNISYTVTVTVGMNSGLSGESSTEFTVSLADSEYWPDAEIIYDEDNFTTSIRPYCENNGVLIDGILLSVYRREFDGTFTELATDINNTDRTYITDPHPSLDYARYRIVAKDSSSGSISYYDVPGYPINETSVIIQWDEKWQNFDLTDDKLYEVNGITYSDELEQHSWSGSLIKLPYNIDVSDDHQVDVSLVKYIGRKHPVSYYGTQLGSTSSWSMEIPKEDKQTLYALRRLAAWAGDVYVREPSGSGYWASITVSFSQAHRELTIPITINITRVEGDK